MNSEARNPSARGLRPRARIGPEIGDQTHRRHRHGEQKGRDDADRRGDLRAEWRSTLLSAARARKPIRNHGKGGLPPLAVAGEAEPGGHFAERDDHRRHHRDAGQFGDRSELSGVAAALKGRRDGLSDLVDRSAGPQAVGARRQMQEALRQRIGEHGERAEQGHAGDRVSRVVVLAAGRGFRRDHRRGAADRGADADQQREPARDAERAAHDEGEGQSRNERGGDHGEAAAAEFGGLPRRDLQAQQDDGEAQDGA